MSDKASFVVVGAGPAGLSLAYLLAKADLAVTLIDANPSFSRQFRGDALMPCGQEALSRMGLTELVQGLPQRELAGWSVWIERQRLFQVSEPMGCLQPCRLVAQKDLLEALLERAQRLPSFRWLPGRHAKQLLHCGERINGVQLDDGQCLRADLVVGCDGRQSTLRRQAGVALKPQGSPLELLWLELPAPLPAANWDHFNTLVAGGAIGSACLGANGNLQLAWLLPQGGPTPKLDAQGWAKALAGLMPAEMAAVLLDHGHRLQGPRRLSVQVGMAERWQRPGLLLLGDAAHPMSPVRAQGINMALRDSLVAADWLSQAATDQLDHAAAAVERQRRPEIKRMQALQRAEAHQGQRVGSTPLLRNTLSRAAALLGPIAKQVWMSRQGPLREGLMEAITSTRINP